jgi:hypothetical protein
MFFFHLWCLGGSILYICIVFDIFFVFELNLFLMEWGLCLYILISVIIFRLLGSTISLLPILSSSNMVADLLGPERK